MQLLSRAQQGTGHDDLAAKENLRRISPQLWNYNSHNCEIYTLVKIKKFMRYKSKPRKISQCQNGKKYNLWW